MRYLLAIIALCPVFAYAEVMDKEQSLYTILLWCAFGTLAATLAACYRPWLLLLVLPCVGFFFAGQLIEVLDPYIGPALAAEAGASYIVVSCVAPVLLLFGAGMGFLLRFRSAARSP